MNAILAVCSLPLLSVLTSGSLLPAPGENGAYERVMDRVLAKAQSELQKTMILREERNWANPWEARSKRYITRAVQSHAFAKNLGAAMEQMAPLIQALIKPDFKWPTPMPIWVVPDSATYNQLGTSGGDAHSSIYSSYFATSQNGRPVVVLHDSNDTLLKISATHSAVHQFVAAAYPSTTAQAWMQEGLAAYLSLYWKWEWAESELARFAADKQLIPIRTLLARSSATYGRKAHQNFIELGMFFNYLLHYREDTRSTPGKQDGPFVDYIRKTLSGQNIADHPVQLLLFRKTGEVEKGFRAQKF